MHPSIKTYGRTRKMRLTNFSNCDPINKFLDIIFKNLASQLTQKNGSIFFGYLQKNLRVQNFQIYLKNGSEIFCWQDLAQVSAGYQNAQLAQEIPNNRTQNYCSTAMENPLYFPRCACNNLFKGRYRAHFIQLVPLQLESTPNHVPYLK